MWNLKLDNKIFLFSFHKIIFIACILSFNPIYGSEQTVNNPNVLIICIDDLND